jgi:hypothetical protein
MNREDARKLLGGYATGNLTAEERRLLFEAALDDQELFDALAEEQALKDVLDDPVSRERVRLAVAAAPRPRGWWARPWIWVPAVGALAAAVLTVTLVNWKPGEIHEATKNTTVADNRPALKDAAPASPVAPGDTKVRSKKAPVPKVVADKFAGPAATPPPAPAAAAPPKDAETPKQAEAPAAQSSANTAAHTGNTANTANTSGGPGNTRSDGENTQQQNVGQQARRESQQSVGGAVNETVQVTTRAAALSLARPTAGRAGAAPLAWSLVRDEADGRESELAAGVRPRLGDRVRLRVTTSAPGYIEVSVRDSSGAWQPRSKKIAVVANAVYTIPEAPLEVTPGEALRLTWSPEEAADELQDRAQWARKSKEQIEKKAAPASSRRQVVTEIPLH